MYDRIGSTLGQAALIIGLAATALTATAPSPARGQLGSGATPIPGWLERFETDAITQDLVRAQGFWVHKNWIDCVGETCTLELEPLLALDDDPTQPFCNDLEITGRPHLDTPGHFGGALVGPDLFLTVHNLSDQACTNRRIVFDFAVDDLPSPLLNELAPGETLRFEVPSEKVRHCAAVLAGGGTAGWTLVRLDQPVTDRQPLKLRRSGQLAIGTMTHTAGFPNRLPMKVEHAPLTATGVGTGSNSAHVLGSSSGSSVIGPGNRLEGVVCCGTTGWMREINGCYRPADEISSHASFNRPTGLDLNLVPALGLDVDNLAPAPENPLRVDHYGPPGGPFSFERMEQILRAGPGGDAVDWAVSLPLGPVLYFAPEAGQPLTGHLEPGASTPLTVAATQAVYDAPVGEVGGWIAYVDQQYETVDLHEHVFHVGTEGFERSCLDGQFRCRADEALIGTGPSGLLDGDSQRYRLVNRWDVTQRVRVLGPSWMRVTADIAVFETAPGTAVLDMPPGAKVEVTIILDETDMLGSLEDTVTFQSENDGTVLHSESFLVRGDLGRVTFDDAPNAVFAAGTSIELPTTPTFPMPLSVLDVDVCISLWPDNSFATPDTAPALRLRAPSGREIDLGAYWGNRCFSHDVFQPVAVNVVKVDSMARLAGEAADGTWTLRIEAPSDPPWKTARVATTSWRLRVDAP